MILAHVIAIFVVVVALLLSVVAFLRTIDLSERSHRCARLIGAIECREYRLKHALDEAERKNNELSEKLDALVAELDWEFTYKKPSTSGWALVEKDTDEEV